MKAFLACEFIFGAWMHPDLYFAMELNCLPMGAEEQADSFLLFCSIALLALSGCGPIRDSR